MFFFSCNRGTLFQQCYVPAWIGVDFRVKYDTYVCMVESVCHSPETITPLLTGVCLQHKKFKVWKKQTKKDIVNTFPVFPPNAQCSIGKAANAIVP